MVYSTTDRQFQGINRTICIGLGGTGRDVLMRIRRLIVDRYGDLANLPIVSFVHIDTDKAASQAAGLKTGNIYHGVDLSFKDSEKVSATMTSAEVTNFVRGAERRVNADRPSPYDHIIRWFPPQLYNNIKAVEEGAKGIRPVGRLAFFHNYRQIRAAIETAEQRTRGHDKQLMDQGLKSDPGLNIFVVGSLCGGTGSGMFLDVAYSLRRDYGDQGAKIVGYFVISPKLYGNAPSMNANTYAALKELNHYTTPGTRFDACYDMQDLVIVQEDRPPFEYTYLVSNSTSGEYTILEQRKLCNVIAHKIALDFSGELAPVVKGMRDNFLQYLINWDSHPRPNPQRYLTFGLAAIYFPRDRIIQIALNRIAFKLTNFWLEGEGQSPDSQLLLEQFLLQNNWHNDLNQRDGISQRLAEAVQENNKKFTSTINTWRSKLERAVSECKKKDDRLAVRQQLAREFRLQFRKVQPGETESSRGIWLTRLQEISSGITVTLKQNIDNFLVSLLTPSNSNFSIKSSRSFLGAVLNELNNYQFKIEESIRNFNGYKTQEEVDRKWQHIEQEIEELEQKLDLLGLGSKNREIQKQARQGIQQVNNLVKHNFDLAVQQESLQIVKDLITYIQEHSTQITKFKNLVTDIKNNYEKTEAMLRQLNFNEMSGEAILSDDDIEECFEILIPKQEVYSQLVLLSKDITEPKSESQSLASFVKDRMTIEQLHEEIKFPIERSFGTISGNVVKSVVKRFMQNYASYQASTRLGQIMQEANPLLRLNLSDPYFQQDPAKESKLIGFKDADNVEVEQFKRLLTQDLGIKDDVLRPTQAEDEILIVTEYAAFPLRLIYGLDRMRNAYIRQMNQNSSFLHNDNPNLFTDIIPPDAIIMEELEDILYPCLAFELLSQTESDAPLEFQYYDSLRDTSYIAALSPIWNQALETLATRQDLTDALRKLLDDEINKIEEQPSLWKEYYLHKLTEFEDKVRNLPKDSPNHIYESTVVGTTATATIEAKEGVITRFRIRLQRKLQNSQSQLQIADTNIGTQKHIEGKVEKTDYADSTSGNSQTSGIDMTLKELIDAKKEGNITEEEFEIAKKKIFGR